MLDTFLVENRDRIVRRYRTRAEARAGPTPTPVERNYGVHEFLDQLVIALRRSVSTPEMDLSAALHGRARHLQGATISQVVHDYGDVCQSITELAIELGTPISVEDFRHLNGFLDNAIASAVTEFGHGSRSFLEAESARVDERLGFLAHEIRNLVGTASAAFEVMRTGNVGVGGSTGAVLQRSLVALRELISRSVVEIRLHHDVRERTEFSVAEFLTELAPAAALDAAARGLTFNVQAGDEGITVNADRTILTAVVANLLQNAFKFTRPATTVVLRGSATVDRVVIEVEDECGGLPGGNVTDLFQPYEQRGADRTGLGLGLAISRWGAEVNGGRVYARNLPDHGCIFTLSLPRTMPLASV